MGLLGVTLCQYTAEVKGNLGTDPTLKRVFHLCFNKQKVEY